VAIGFVGLGNIGKPMAQQLLKLGEELWVLDVAPGPVRELEARGAHGATAAQVLGARCRIVGVCVRDEAETESLLAGPSGLLASLAADAVLAIHSTVTVQAIRGWAARAAERGIHLLDAPMTGGAAAAERGTLVYMAGGAPLIIERCRPLWATSAHKIIHAGPVGTGMLLKLCNNLLTYAAFTSLHEARRLAEAGGLDPALLDEVGRGNGVVTAQMEAFIAARAQLQTRGAAALAQGFGPFAALGAKDLAAALASARELNVALPATAAVAQLIEAVFLDQP
jgi:3-hydroxyisobutyrate dehydrogenase